MKIAFISVRGIPNNYGGFEQFAEYISVGLVKRGHEVTVYSPHFHPYKASDYKGVHIKHIQSPETWMGGSVGSFFYDFRSLKDALKNEDFDIIYEAGYTSIIPAYIWFNVKNIKRPIFTTNMDGLEYRRTKYGPLVRRFVNWEERMAVKHSHYLISDNMGIHDYYREHYGRESEYLAYGADIDTDYDATAPGRVGLNRGSYYLVIARLEPENNVEMVIRGYLDSKQCSPHTPLVIVGNTSTKHGKYLSSKYAGISAVRFIGTIYDFRTINSLRHYSSAYFHGHSVGGTNPSLLEAMASGCFIFANDNPFNRTILKDNALYFSTSDDVTSYFDNLQQIATANRADFIRNNLREIEENYSWDHLVDLYEQYFNRLLAAAEKE